MNKMNNDLTTLLGGEQKDLANTRFPRVTPEGNPLTFEQTMGAGEYLSLTSRMLFLLTDMMPATNYQLCQEILALSASSNEPIKLFVASRGGELGSTLNLCNLVKMVDVPVYTIAAQVASGAALLASCGSRRFSLPSSRIMLHMPFGSVSGDADTIAIQAKQIKQAKDSIIALLLDNGAKRTHEEILKDINREFWMGSEEAVTYGIVDEILTAEKLKELLGL